MINRYLEKLRVELKRHIKNLDDTDSVLQILLALDLFFDALAFLEFKFSLIIKMIKIITIIRISTMIMIIKIIMQD